MSRLRALWVAHGQLVLFLCLSSLFVVYPHLANTFVAKVSLDTIFTLSIVASLYPRVSIKRWLNWIYGGIGVIGIITTWLATVVPLVGNAIPYCYALFFGIGVVIHFRALLSEPDVDVDTLLGACCTYMLIGLLFASLYAVLMQWDPAGLRLTVDDGDPLYQLTYFSFITLTTVGYGDVVPVSNATRMLAAYEAIIGQVFMAIVVGMLVGKHLASRPNKRTI
ncbi:MAG: potassium channel family protein [Planctomycetota bacterium]